MPRWVRRGQPGDDDSDFAAVDQAVHGECTADELYREDRLAAVAELWRRGYGQRATAERLSTSKRQVEADRQHLRYRARNARTAA